jgi:hypothetical protein
MGAPHFHRAVPQFRKGSRVRIVFNMDWQVQRALKNGDYRDIAPAKIRRSNETSVKAINQAWNTDTYACKARTPETSLQLSSNLLPELSEKSMPIRVRPHGSLVENSAVEIADSVYGLVNANADAYNVCLFSVDLQVFCRTASAGRRRLALVNNRSPQQTVDDYGYSASAQAGGLAKVNPRDGLPVADDMQELELICLANVFHPQHPQFLRRIRSHPESLKPYIAGGV